MATEQLDEREFGPWNPGIKSTLPLNYLPLSTMFRPQNVFTSLEDATELSGFTGLGIQQLVCFRPERLVIHELLIRVSADIFVSDGSKYEDLGINYRNIVDTILAEYIQPHLSGIIEQFSELSARVETMVETELAASLFVEPARIVKQRNAFSFAKLFKAKPQKLKPADVESVEQRHHRILSSWEQKAESSDDALLRSMR